MDGAQIVVLDGGGRKMASASSSMCTVNKICFRFSKLAKYNRSQTKLFCTVNSKRPKKQRDERGHLHTLLGVHILSITLEVHHLDKASNFTAIIFCHKSSYNHFIVLYSSLHTNIFRSVVTSMKKSVITVSTVFTLSMSFAFGPWKMFNCLS